MIIPTPILRLNSVVKHRLFIALSCLGVADLLILSEGTSTWLLTTAGILAAVCLLSQRNMILRYFRMHSESLATIETLKPKMPKKFEVAATNALIGLLLVLSIQFIGIVYAMAYTLASSSTETLEARHLISADADNDGDLDYVALNYSTSAVDINLYVNDGTGVFAKTTVANLANVWDGCFADVDSDGDSDVLLIDAASIGSERLRVLRNTAGSFASISTVTLQSQSRTLVCTDIDDDGDIDAVLGSTQVTMTQAVFLNNSHGVFTAAASTLYYAGEMVAADFNSDGYMDLATTDVGGYLVFIYRGSGTGAFVEIDEYGGVDYMQQMAAADVEGDGDIDLLITSAQSSDNLFVFRNNGTGDFTNDGVQHDFNFGTSPDDMIAGDTDNDGDVDVLGGAADPGPANGNELLRNNGSATYTTHWQLAGTDTTTTSLLFLDFDNDGDLDYVRGNSNGTANNRYLSDAAATTANTAPTAPSTGFGATFYAQNNQITTLDSASSVGENSSVAIGADGYPVMSHFDSNNEELKVTKCGNAACSSGNTTTAVDSGVGSDSSMVLGSDNVPVISYLSSTAQIKVIKCGNAACSSGNTTTTVDSTSTFGTLSMTLASDGFPVISYYNVSSGDLKVTKCGNAACSSGNTTTTVDSTGDVGTSSSIVLGADNLPVISYTDTTNSDLKVIKCGNAACSAGNTTTTVDSTDFTGHSSSIVLGSDDFPVISYIYFPLAGEGDLKVVKCGNAACSSGNTFTTLESAIVDTSSATSIGIGNDAFPVIGYFVDGLRVDLKVAKCGNAACSSGNTLTTVDGSADYVADSLSLQVLSDGRPIISYHDNSNDDLKFVRCGNASCSTGGTDGAITFRLSWGSGSDTETSTRLLQYQLKVGTGTNANNIVSGKTASPNWVSRLMPNGQSRTYFLKNLACGNGATYYWSVAVVDTGFMSTASSEQTFTLDSSCNVTTGGGGTTGSTGGGGGGGAAWLQLLRSTKTGVSSSAAYGFLTIVAFKDMDGNGEHGDREVGSFQGLPVTIIGKTIEGKNLKQTVLLDANGTVKVKIRESDSQGYSVVFGTGSDIVDDFIPTGKDVMKVVVKEGTDTEVETGFQREDLLRLLPCMRIAAEGTNEIQGSPALTLLQRLNDIFGNPIAKDTDLTLPLMSRKDFLTLLQRAHCIDLLSQSQVQEKLRASFIANTMPGWTSIELLDLPLEHYTQDARLVYSLLAHGLPAVRGTVKGGVADLKSPISRREAIHLTEAAMKIPLARRQASGTLLPTDLPADDPLTESFQALSNLGVLPESFLPVLGADLGLDGLEAPTLLIRSAFRAGRIDLLPEIKKEGTEKTSFLSVLPPFEIPSCVERNKDRPEKITFTDVLPGSPLYEVVHSLLIYGTKGADNQTLWLVPATPRMSEFGVEKAETTLKPSDNVSILEVLRSLLVLSCLPPDSRASLVTTGAKGTPIGSGESRIPRDRISDLLRDSSLASRILYRSQDRIKEFDLSLFSFAPNLLRQNARSPSAPLHLRDASELLASALLGILVKNRILTYAEAEGKMQELSHTLLEELLGTEVTDRNGDAGTKIPLTRKDFLLFLSAAVKGVAAENEDTTEVTETLIQIDAGTVPIKSAAPAINPASILKELPLGEIWWERVK